MYEYYGKVVSVYDADTMTIDIDLGFNITIREKVRVYGIDTPELRTRNKEEKKLGYKARDLVRDKVLGKKVGLKAYKPGKFGRYLVDVYYDDINLAEELIDAKLALPYFGEKKDAEAMKKLIEENS